MKNYYLFVLTAVLGLVYGLLRSQPDIIDAAVLEGLRIAVLISSSVFLIRMTSYLLIDVFFTQSRKKQPSDLLRFIVSIFLYGTSAVILLKFFLHQNIAAILATSALITAIVGFALQATLGNLFAGVALQLEQPFHIGDLIRLSDRFGIVEEIRWRSVSIRTGRGDLVVIPNSNVSGELVEVFPSGHPIERNVTIPAPITTRPQKVIQIVNDVIRTVPNVNLDEKSYVVLKGFDNAKASLMYEVVYCPEDYNIAAFTGLTDSTIRERVWYAFSRNGIEIPIPIYVDEADTPLAVFRHEIDSSPPIHSDLEVISSIDIFKSLNPEEKELLAKSLVRLAFAPGEPITPLKDSKYSMFIVSRGSVSVQLATVTGNEIEMVERFENGTKPVPISRWDPEVLENITKAFVYYVGPLAGFLVKKAAPKTLDPYRLYRILAQEISDPSERSVFLSGSPPFPVVELEAGDFFGERSLFTGESPLYNQNGSR